MPATALNDPVLPGLATALDAERFLDLLEGELRAAGEAWEVAGGRVSDVQYRPGSSCLVLYRVRFRHRADGRTTRRFVTARLLREGETAPALPSDLVRRYGEYRRRVTQTPVVELPHMVVTQFPVDPELPWLMDAVQASVAKRHLGRALEPAKLRVREASSEMLGYTPQSRATMAYDVVVEHRRTGRRSERRLVGKTHFRKPPEKLFANAWALARAADGAVQLAAPIGYAAPLRMTVQEQISGDRLANFAGTPSFVPLVRRTARSIAQVHGLSLPFKRRRDTDAEARVVNRWSDVLCAIRPDLRGRIDALRGRLIAQLEASAVPTATVHGDFHPGNILTEGETITLIDLDDVATADPFVDVGRFLASLRVSAMRVAGDPGGLVEAEHAFLDEYLGAGSDDEPRARLFEAASLLIAAGTPFRLQRDGWEDATEQLLAEAEAVFELAADTPSSPPVPDERPRVARRERLGWATDPMFMQATLDPYVADAYGARVSRCIVRSTREQPMGHEISYRLRGWRADEKWSVMLRGVIWREGSGRRFGRALAALRAALEDVPEAPVLPLPVAYLSQFSLLIFERLDGDPLSARLGDEGAGPAVARALGALSAVDAELPEWTLEDELAAVPGVPGSVADRCRDAGAAAAPVLRPLDPRDVLIADGGRIAIAGAREAVLAHPLLAPADFLARLAATGLRDGDEEAAQTVASTFRSAWPAELAAFEALALLRVAGDAEQEGAGGLAAALRERAARC